MKIGCRGGTRTHGIKLMRLVNSPLFYSAIQTGANSGQNKRKETFNDPPPEQPDPLLLWIKSYDIIIALDFFPQVSSFSDLVKILSNFVYKSASPALVCSFACISRVR